MLRGFAEGDVGEGFVSMGDISASLTTCASDVTLVSLLCISKYLLLGVSTCVLGPAFFGDLFTNFEWYLCGATRFSRVDFICRDDGRE